MARKRKEGDPLNVLILKAVGIILFLVIGFAVIKSDFYKQAFAKLFMREAQRIGNAGRN